MSSQESHFYEFGPFRLDPVKRRLMRDGEPISLTPKAFDTLLVLVRQSGKTIEKDDLMQEVWPDAVVEENNLNQNITALRRCLGDSRQDSQFIATIPGLGYRFVAEVRRAPVQDFEFENDRVGEHAVAVERRLERRADERVGASDSPAPSAAATSRGSVTQPALDSSKKASPESPAFPPAGESFIAAVKRHKRVATLVFSAIVIGVAVIAVWVFKIVSPQATETTTEIQVAQLTRTGTAGNAAISPDGKHIIYTVREGGRESLWLRQVAASSAQQIIPAARVKYGGVTFSPDGNHINFIRTEGDPPGRVLYRMPALGGVATKVLSDIDTIVTFSPDGKRIAFVRNSNDESALIVADADGDNQQKLATRPVTDHFKVASWSPDGKHIACSAGSGEPYDIHNSVIAVRVEDGTQTPATAQRWAYTNVVQWLSDGSGILVTGRELHEAPDQVWHISYPSGEVRRLTTDSKLYRSISLSSDSRLLLAVQTELLSDVWLAEDWKTDQARKIIFGSGSYERVCYLPDGRIVYASQASGNSDIWTMDADGSHAKQLTADSGVNLHQTVSIDGRYIVFASNRAGVFNIWRMNSDGSDPIKLTSGSGEKFPACSPDGKWVIYNSVASDKNLYALWRVPIEGGEPVRLTDGNTAYPAISPDGKYIACFLASKVGSRFGLIPLGGGSPERTFAIAKDVDLLPYIRWSPDGQSLAYSAARDDICNIWIQPLSGGEARQLTHFKLDGWLQFDWSRDGRQLVFTRRLWTADLALLRSFLPGK
jgi:Tol biopolymer transport system component/DNA-binding winged helix-turn-helix (wHTH) protein